MKFLFKLALSALAGWVCTTGVIVMAVAYWSDLSFIRDWSGLLGIPYMVATGFAGVLLFLPLSLDGHRMYGNPGRVRARAEPRLGAERAEGGYLERDCRVNGENFALGT